MFILWAVILGGAGGILTTIGPWYRNLKKPSWQPPDWLFGPAAIGWQFSLANLNGVQLLTLAPGAFILLGLLLAAAHSFHHDDRP